MYLNDFNQVLEDQRDKLHENLMANNSKCGFIKNPAIVLYGTKHFYLFNLNTNFFISLFNTFLTSLFSAIIASSIFYNLANYNTRK